MPVADLHSKILDAPGPIFFIFFIMQFLAKFGPLGLALPSAKSLIRRWIQPPFHWHLLLDLYFEDQRWSPSCSKFHEIMSIWNNLPF